MEQPTSYDLLNKIDSPEDLRKLSVEALPEVCNQLRNKIIDELSRNPGHFGSSLGVVELTWRFITCIRHLTTASCGMWGIRHTDIRF